MNCPTAAPKLPKPQPHHRRSYKGAPLHAGRPVSRVPPPPLLPPLQSEEGIGVGVEVKEEMRERCEKMKIKTAYNKYMAHGRREEAVVVVVDSFLWQEGGR